MDTANSLQFNQETAHTLSHATVVIGESEETQADLIAGLTISPHDTVVLQAAESGGIKEVREFNNQLLLSPQFGDIRLGVIYSADKLTPQAQSALLKLLEEPPSRTRIVLFVATVGSILPTVISRCRRYSHTARVSVKELAHTVLSGDLLEQFLATEAIAKDENVLAIARSWMMERYNKWCSLGRPAHEVEDIERYWQLYRDVEANLNKRLIFERHVLWCL